MMENILNTVASIFDKIESATLVVYESLVVQLNMPPFLAGFLIVLFYVIVLCPLWNNALTRWLVSCIFHRKDSSKRDSTRLFTNKQCIEMYGAVGHRCEHRKFIIFRCRKKGSDLQADHWFPWSKGGATSNKNFVALCSHHNRSKSAKVPTRWQTFVLSFARRFYMDSYVKPGQWKF